MTPRIYQDAMMKPGDGIELSPGASHHLVKVLRARPGMAITVFNGDGNEYRAELDQASTRHCTAQIMEVTGSDNESPLRITLIQGLSRHDRMDTSLQKATELGVTAIIPAICMRSKFRLDGDRIAKKMAHWRQIIISACEQSGRCVVPRLHEPVSLDTAIDLADAGSSRLVLLPEAGNGLADIEPTPDSVCLLIGPESGFDDIETAAATTRGFIPVRFGSRVLRTETAGPAAIAAVQVLWGDMGN